MTVGRRALDLCRTDGAAGAALIVDDDCLAELAREIFAKGARDTVSLTAGRIGYDNADLLRRKSALRR